MSRHGFTRGSDSGIAIREFEAIEQKVREFTENGQLEVLKKAITYARKATRNWIAQTAHPKEAFNGKKLYEHLNEILRDKKGQKYSTKSQFRLGHFGMIGHGGGRNGKGNGHADEGEISSLNIYANYLARWYSTGLTTRGYYGNKIIYQRSGVAWWEKNATNIKNYYLLRVDAALQNRIGRGLL